MTPLSADTGGICNRLAGVNDNGRSESANPDFAKAGFDSLDDVIERGLGGPGTSGQSIDHGARIVPLPVHADRASLGHIDWRTHRAAPQQGFDANTPAVINAPRGMTPGTPGFAGDDLVVAETALLQDGPGLLDNFRFLNADQHPQTTLRDIVEAEHQGNESADEAISLFVAVFFRLRR
jgi:glucokinase